MFDLDNTPLFPDTPQPAAGDNAPAWLHCTTLQESGSGVIMNGRIFGRIALDMSTAKQDVELLLNKLPDDCSVEDIQYHLYVLDKVRRGLEDAQSNGTLSQEEVESRLNRWLSE
jgi:hypothetical protein